MSETTNLSVMTEEERTRAHAVARQRFKPSWWRTLLASAFGLAAMFISIKYLLPATITLCDAFLTTARDHNGFTWLYLALTFTIGITAVLLAPTAFSLMYGNRERRSFVLLAYVITSIAAYFMSRFATGEYPTFAYFLVWIIPMSATGIMRLRWVVLSIILVGVAVFAPFTFLTGEVSRWLSIATEFWKN